MAAGYCRASPKCGVSEHSRFECTMASCACLFLTALRTLKPGEQMPATYEHSVSRLETIVGHLGNDAKPLSEALQLFEEALECLQNASEQLSAVEEQVQRLLETADGAVAIR